MKKAILALTVFVFSLNSAFATWSIIIIDPKTKEIGIAGASCTSNCYGIGKIIPGVGAIIVQAMSNGKAREKGVVMIKSGATPAQIISVLRSAEFDPERQQYAVVTIEHIDSPATYTGDSTAKFNGALAKPGVSVQGNILASEDELEIIMAAVEQGRKDSLDISEILMNALLAGATAGGDRRCGEQKATSAFIVVAKPGDKEPYLNLKIFGLDNGGANAVEMLRNEFEEQKRKRR